MPGVNDFNTMFDYLLSPRITLRHRLIPSRFYTDVMSGPLENRSLLRKQKTTDFIKGVQDENVHRNIHQKKYICSPEAFLLFCFITQLLASFVNKVTPAGTLPEQYTSRTWFREIIIERLFQIYPGSFKPGELQDVYRIFMAAFEHVNRGGERQDFIAYFLCLVKRYQNTRLPTINDEELRFFARSACTQAAETLYRHRQVFTPVVTAAAYSRDEGLFIAEKQFHGYKVIISRDQNSLYRIVESAVKPVIKQETPFSIENIYRWAVNLDFSVFVAVNDKNRKNLNLRIFQDRVCLEVTTEVKTDVLFILFLLQTSILLVLDAKEISFIHIHKEKAEYQVKELDEYRVKLPEGFPLHLFSEVRQSPDGCAIECYGERESRVLYNIPLQRKMLTVLLP